MHQYQNHPIYGIGVRGPGNEWSCKGLIFDAVDQVTEIKRLDCAEATFATEDQAREYGLKLCKTWINEQSGGTNPASAQAKNAIMKSTPV
jgi:hypothetical protein